VLPFVSDSERSILMLQLTVGAIVIANAWYARRIYPRTGLSDLLVRGMLHDPTAYPDPFAFKPERFLGADGTFRDDPMLTSAFGFGRRLCPARHFVDSSLFLSVSCILAVFRVGPPKDELGNEIPVSLKDSGTNSRYGIGTLSRARCKEVHSLM